MSHSHEFNHPAPHAIDLLLSRRSGSAKAMKEPGPSKKQLGADSAGGARAPDHGKLFPWRFILFEGKGRERAGDILAEVMEAEGERGKQVEEERARFLRAPVVIGVVSAAPRAAQDSGLGAGTVGRRGMPEHADRRHRAGLCRQLADGVVRLSSGGEGQAGAEAGERIAGFIYIGTAKEELEERPVPIWTRS